MIASPAAARLWDASSFSAAAMRSASRPASRNAAAAGSPLPPASASRRCSASTVRDPARRATARASATAALLSGANRRNIFALTEIDAGGLQPLGVLLVRRLPRDTERIGDVGPAPCGPERPLDMLILEPVRQPPQRHDRGEPFRRILGADRCDRLIGLHGVNLS